MPRTPEVAGSGGDWAPSITTDWLMLHPVDGGVVNTVAVRVVRSFS